MCWQKKVLEVDYTHKLKYPNLFYNCLIIVCRRRLVYLNLKMKSPMDILIPSGQNGVTRFAVHVVLVEIV